MLREPGMAGWEPGAEATLRSPGLSATLCSLLTLIKAGPCSLSIPEDYKTKRMNNMLFKAPKLFRFSIHEDITSEQWESVEKNNLNHE